MPSYYRAGRYERKKEKEAKKRLQEGLGSGATFKKKQKPSAEISIFIGKTIAMIREDCGLTQAKVSELAGTTQSVVARIEKGRHNLTLGKLEKIAKAMGKKLIVVLK